MGQTNIIIIVAYLLIVSGLFWNCVKRVYLPRKDFVFVVVITLQMVVILTLLLVIYGILDFKQGCGCPNLNNLSNRELQMRAISLRTELATNTVDSQEYSSKRQQYVEVIQIMKYRRRQDVIDRRNGFRFWNKK